jgi:hypothetical protein
MITQKRIMVFLSFCLCLYYMPMNTMACPPGDYCDPALCLTWNGSSCVSTCSGCKSCSNGSCVDDNNKCTGCQSCSSGTCVDDSSKCSSNQDCCNGVCGLKLGEVCTLGNCCSTLKCTSRFLCEQCETNNDCAICEQCVGLSNPRRCISVLPCPTYTHCANHACEPDCQDGQGGFCSWSYPNDTLASCPEMDPTDKQCSETVKDQLCTWIITSTILLLNGACVSGYPNCTMLPSYCVELTPYRCDDEWWPVIGRICHCCVAGHDGGTYHGNPGTPVLRGTGYRCP